MNLRFLLAPGLLLGALLTAAGLVGCATPTPTISSTADAKVDFARYQSFQMLQPVGYAPRNPAITPMLIREVRDEAGRALATKGLKKSGAYSDLLVLVHGGVQDKLAIRDWGLSYRRFARQEIESHPEGTLFVDVFDAQTREMIWRGTAVAPVSEVPDVAALKATVASIIARYPN